MRAENYIAFFTVCGFFTGIIWSFIKAQEAIDMLIYTVLITFFYYLIIHIIIMNYVDIKTTIKKFFDKEKHEEIADYLLSELAIREKRIEHLIIMQEPETKQKTTGKTNARAEAKAA
ncbi:hypothetical protein BB381_02770 [Campylobacter pinnipediorum subsp. caledonicus]|uniref:hypothetical protein n=1 Tax=Campylobacter pinnipediorum TaxID=1965231 RepID=UPI0009956D08|nr:hypothetical protein [Campylobacter pinnipediorum]AQW86337.1 putative membrane protein [Campylobacter pinnipediorum subsp. caledonicus]OPA71435.1 hypothetical protein BB381_02770 [Campylobacter pinnipediorum subsp. caledonicus]